MQNVSVYKLIKYNSENITPKGISMMKMYGVTKDRLNSLKFECYCSFDMEQGDVVLIDGPSGSGKSVLMELIRHELAGSDVFDIDKYQFNNALRVVDHIPCENLYDTMVCLRNAGLNDFTIQLNPPKNLSAGQQWRLKMAVALASKKKIILSDEFCANLDVLTMMGTAHRVRNFATEHKITFILASSNENMHRMVMPDIRVSRGLGGQTDVLYSGICGYYAKRPVRWGRP